MKIKTIKSKFMRGSFDQNTYVLIKGKEAIIIDAGAEIEDVKNALQGAKVLAILITHLHFDHIWNIEKYLKEFDADIFIVSGHQNYFDDSKLNASFMIRKDMHFNVSEKRLKNYAKKLNIGSFNIDVFFTPGHSADSVCLLIENDLFSGDTVFDDGIGRTDLFDSSNEDMKNSLKFIKTINFDFAYPGHFNSTDRAKILKTISYYID